MEKAVVYWPIINYVFKIHLTPAISSSNYCQLTLDSGMSSVVVPRNFCACG